MKSYNYTQTWRLTSITDYLALNPYKQKKTSLSNQNNIYTVSIYMYYTLYRLTIDTGIGPPAPLA